MQACSNNGPLDCFALLLHPSGWLARLVFCGALLVAGCEDHLTSEPAVTRLVVTIVTDSRGCEIYDELFNRYEREHPNIRVEKIYVFSGNYYQKLLTMIAGNIAPDVMWMGEGFNEFAQRGAFLDVTSRIPSIDTTDFLKPALQWYRLNDRQYGIPFGVDMRFIVYNRRLFRDAGVKLPESGWDFEAFLAAAKELTVRKEGQVVQWGFYGSLDPASFGARFVSGDGTRADCENPETMQFLQTNLDLLNRYQVTPSLRDIPANAIQDPISIFQQGRVAMMPMNTWDLPGLRDRCAAMDWDIVENPKVAQRGSWASSQAYVISSQTRHPDEAWKLVQALTGPWFQKQMGYAMLPANLAVAREVIAENQSMPKRLDTLIAASDALYPSPRVAHLQELYALFTDAQQSVWIGRETPERAMAIAAKEMNNVIRRHRRTTP